MRDRKQDHIALALEGSLRRFQNDTRFDYEPLLSGHQTEHPPLSFVGRPMKLPFWISSMTGGTEKAFTLNERLAQACREFGLGMALGSCRPLLEEKAPLKDFNWRKTVGDGPFWANLGIAQIEKKLEEGKILEITQMLSLLSADGLFVHINPLQEALQPEGDRLKSSALEILKALCQEASFPIAVKEVGQGMGPTSLSALWKLPIVAFETAAFGGTNFCSIELQRGKREFLSSFVSVGQSLEEMIPPLRELMTSDSKEIILSGGIKDFLDGYYYQQLLGHRGLYGQATPFLLKALESYGALASYIKQQKEGLLLAQSFLQLRKKRS